MITNHKLLVDRDCPMCRAYGKAFVKFKLVDEKTIHYYQTVKTSVAKRIDLDRARNEIALHDTNTGHTKYGVDAFIRILAHNKPVLHRLLNFKLIYALLVFLYKFISYNRKVIYPIDSRISCTCDPELNKKYRAIYITFVAFFTGYLLNSFFFHVNTAFNLAHSPLRELIVCIGQVVWQGAAIYLIFREKFWDYLGNMSTVSLIGGLLLLPVLILNHYLSIHPFALMAAFTVVVGLMFLEHIRRCKLLGVPLTLTVSWVLFRIVVLSVIVLTIVL